MHIIEDMHALQWVSWHYRKSYNSCTSIAIFVQEVIYILDSNKSQWHSSSRCGHGENKEKKIGDKGRLCEIPIKTLRTIISSMTALHRHRGGGLTSIINDI